MKKIVLLGLPEQEQYYSIALSGLLPGGINISPKLAVRLQFWTLVLHLKQQLI